jgi:hypothetical protein
VPGSIAKILIDSPEDREDYRAFETAVIGEYDARTARELVLA